MKFRAECKNDNTFAGVHPHVSTWRQTPILSSDSALSLLCWENKGRERTAELDFFFPVYDSAAISLVLIWEIRRRKLISKNLSFQREVITKSVTLHIFTDLMSTYTGRKTTFRDSLRGGKVALTLAVSHLFNRNWPGNTVNVGKPQVN